MGQFRQQQVKVLSKQAKVVLSLDYGTKNIGVCIAETYTGQTKPLPVITNNKSVFENLNKPSPVILAPHITKGRLLRLLINSFSLSFINF